MGIGWRELLIILLIALLVFGAKKLRNVGSDLGAAVRGFKKAVNDGESEQQQRQLKHQEPGDSNVDADFNSTGENVNSKSDNKKA